MAGILSQEFGQHGVLVVNVVPGPTKTERVVRDLGTLGIAVDGEPPEVVASVVSWLATEPEAASYNGSTIFAQAFCHERRLLPGWHGPRLRFSGPPDLSGARLAEQSRKFEDAPWKPT